MEARALVGLVLGVLGLAGLAACGDAAGPPGGAPPGPERPACSDRNPLRNAYFGDLHVHTAYSWDAYVFDTRLTPADAYRFARGEPVSIGGVERRLARPLDFAAVTDHAEFLGEVGLCVDPSSEVFSTGSCATFRAGGLAGQSVWGVQTVLPEPMRDAAVCGADGSRCRLRRDELWRRTIEAAEAADDRSARCEFTTFVAYEYTSNAGTSSQHRNVIFANATVPEPVSYLDEPRPQGLWRRLRERCLEAGTGCDVLAIPHNPNQSNGKAFLAEYPGAASPAEEREQAALRARIEPLVEIFQHKGDSECLNGLSGVAGAPDELCGFEKLRRAPFEDCGDGVGAGGTGQKGCVSRRDYLRGFLLLGLEEERRIGVNPFPLGVVASTDTHNGTPGAVEEDSFRGHRGSADDERAERLERNGGRNGVIFNPGGLAGVWAEENSRSAIFSALRRRETFATSGPRIAVRFFGGFDLPGGLCDAPDLVARADAAGVPMGGEIRRPEPPAAAPRFVVAATRDPGRPGRPGTLLQRIQVVKGWLDAEGRPHERVFEVAGDPENGAWVDTATCERHGPGAASLCGVWTDPGFRADEPAFYYARVVENPSCRWTAYECNRLSEGERPATCSDPDVPLAIRERAWTSPIWYVP